MKIYSLNRCKKILFRSYRLFFKKRKDVSWKKAVEIEKNLRNLQQEIINKDLVKSKKLAKECEKACRSVFKKSFFDNVKEFIFAFLVAFVLALVVRQFCFELYQIPTGSMRPTFKELDRLVVSKMSQQMIELPNYISHRVLIFLQLYLTMLDL